MSLHHSLIDNLFHSPYLFASSIHLIFLLVVFIFHSPNLFVNSIASTITIHSYKIIFVSAIYFLL